MMCLIIVQNANAIINIGCEMDNERYQVVAISLVTLACTRETCRQ